MFFVKALLLLPLAASGVSNANTPGAGVDNMRGPGWPPAVETLGSIVTLPDLLAAADTRDLFSLGWRQGRLCVRPNYLAAVPCRQWTVFDDSCRFDRTTPAVHRCHLSTVAAKADIVISGDKDGAVTVSYVLTPDGENARYWYRFSFQQRSIAIGGVRVEWSLRTPLGLPDLVYWYDGNNAEVLLLKYPAVAVELDRVLAAAGQDPLPPSRWMEAKLAGERPQLCPVTQRRVLQLVEALDAPQWLDRERAEQLLKTAGDDVALYLESLDRKVMTPEQDARIDRMLSMYPRVTTVPATQPAPL